MPSTTPRRRMLCALAIVSLAVLGGCLGQFGSGSPGDENQRTCPDERVTTVPYPDRPATLSNDSVRAFVADLERAYVYDRETGDDATNVTFDPEPDAVSRLDDGWSARVETGIATYSCTAGAVSVGDGYYTARYFVNESAVYRAQEAGDGPVDDPRDGGVRLPVGNATTAAA